MAWNEEKDASSTSSKGFRMPIKSDKMFRSL